MKSCPACQRVYTDEMSFCLEDGAALVSAMESASEPAATAQIPAPRLTNQAPTEAFSAEAAPPPQPAQPFAPQRYASERTPAPERKSKALPWILGVVILGLVGIIIGLMMMRGRDDSQTAVDSSQSGNTTPTPATLPTIAETENPPVEPPTGAEQNETPEISERPSPTPKPTQSPRSTPERVAADEPPAPPPAPAATPTRPRAPISGGVLNGKAISRPQPAYPAIARAARASGKVTVQVTIDESGKVVSARAVSGHPLLQQSAVQAAYGARFSPTLLSGQPVKVTGVITYNFVAP
jgi:TonB family protein